MLRIKSGWTCWTDYPFVELGDTPYQEAPIRQVRVLSYDQNKYVMVEVGGKILEVKTGYLYQSRGRYGQVKHCNRRKFERMIPDRHLPKNDK